MYNVYCSRNDLSCRRGAPTGGLFINIIYIILLILFIILLILFINIKYYLLLSPLFKSYRMLYASRVAEGPLKCFHPLNYNYLEDLIKILLIKMII